MRNIFFFFVFVFLSFLVGRFIAFSPVKLPVFIVVSISIIFLSLININIPVYLLIFAMLLSPEIKVAEVPGRAVVIRFDDLLLILMFFTWLFRTAFFKELGLIKRTPLNRFIIYFLIVTYLSTFRGNILGNVTFKKAVFYLLKFTEYAMIYFLVVNILKDEKQVNIFYTLFWVTAVIVIIYGYTLLLRGERVVAPFDEEPGSISGYFLLLFGQSLALSFLHPKKWIRIFGIIVFLSLLPLLLGTESRAGYISFPFVLLGFWIFFPERRTFVLIMSLFILIIGIIVIPSKIKQQAKERWLYTFKGSYEFAGITFEPSAAARLESWQIKTKKWFFRYPFLGAGVTGCGFIDSQYFRYLNEIGLMGFIVFLVLLKNIYNFLKNLLNKSEMVYIPLGLLCSFLGLLIHALTTNTFIIVRIMEPFWFLLALSTYRK
ncbi:MAG: hypothetical protein DRI36_01650 [Caldiserica bacterium]|nr:MAG: hypothetical protein DRI36_01650 [Caldisericota bacterium]